MRRLTRLRRTSPRRRGLVPAIVGFAMVAACASEQFPPGGPVLHTTPKIVLTIPDTNAVNVTAKHVVIKFDRVMSETPSGASALDQMFLISPWDGQPSVDWHRDHITITPRKGIRPNTVYTVIMLPGISDLHSNSIKNTVTLTFSTGATIPATAIRGIIFDWVADKQASKALIEAYPSGDTTKRRDTTFYLAVADSAGRFALQHLPPGTYKVRGWLDANSNRKLDQRELFDSTTVTLADSVRTELLAFIHDTVGPRIGDIKVVDSVTLRATFDKGIDTSQKVSGLRMALKTGKDSTPVPIAKVTAATTYDSLVAGRHKAHDDSLARVDSLRRADSGVTGRDTLALRRRAQQRQSRRDSIAIATRPKPSRPSPTTEIVVELGAPLVPGSSYRLSADSVRNLLKHARSSALAFALPKPPSKDSLAHADSLKARRRLAPGHAPPAARP